MWQHLRGPVYPSAILPGPPIPCILWFGVWGFSPLASVTYTLQVTRPTVHCSGLLCVLYINGIVADVFFGNLLFTPEVMFRRFTH